MARRRGFFAELQYQAQQAERRQLQAQRVQARAHAAAVREVERSRRASERAAAAAARASVAGRKAAEREAKQLHEEARRAEVDELNTQLAEIEDQLDSILVATLDVDDYVDLERLRVAATHPPFPRSDLETPTPAVVPISAPPEPVFVALDAPTGLSSVFGGKKKHAAAVAQAREEFEALHGIWQAEAAAIPGRQLEQTQERDAAEERRLSELQATREVYERECKSREDEIAAANAKLDALIAGLAAGDDSAVREYVGVVLGNSVYPEILSVEHDHQFDPETRELTLTVLLTPPDKLPSEKVYRHVKAQDEITATAIAKKDLKARYASIVHQVALRTLHEVFEADRAGHIQTIALQVATEAADPATGLQHRIVFAGVAADRAAFTVFDLSNVVPSSTLEHLGAAISKNPYELVGLDEIPGVRSR
jgi:restriction system protein